MTGIEPSISTGEPQLSPPEPSLSPLPVARERCAMCGATLAADQLYCVECGQRCGPSRLPFTVTDTPAQRAQQAPSSEPRSRRPRASVNATLIAGIGTLLLALGIGVLIGRLGTGSTSTKPAVQVVTVAGTGGAGAAAGTPGAESSTTASGGTGTAKAGAAAAAKSAKSAAKAPPVPPVKVVKVGSKGSGPGYQHGHFTGNFFGN
ncbi:MAG: hypothetical protein ACHQDY_00845 [Solirubrobacterales bacterium]